MSGDLHEQLAALRKRVAGIDRKYAARTDDAPVPPPRPDPPRLFVEEYLSGQVVETPAGTHFETDRIWERHRRHGSMDITTLQELPDDLLEAISEGSVRRAPVGRWCFLDTETTGLAGGTGTYAFLIGVGHIAPDGFRLKQYFMRDYSEEASLLYALDEYLGQFEVLVTYNGKAYDQPLLETRCRMTRSRVPFGRLQHLDLLFGARRLWRLRLDSCRLVDLENRILGVEREGDLPGELIPYVYFEYLRTREAARIVPILHHNAIDILSLACLTGIVPMAFQSPHTAPVRHGTEMVGLARWLRQCDKPEEALVLFRRAMNSGLPDELMFRTLWDVAALEKKQGRPDASLALYTELAGVRNAFRVAALQELAKHYEHRERNYAMALEMTRAALDYEPSDELFRRASRLENRLKKHSASRRLL